MGNGVLRELTKRYKEIVERYGLEGWVPKDFDFREFMKGLESIQTIPLRQGCLKGDGRSNCEIKACASKKNIADCSACDQPAACNNSQILHKMRTGARRAGLLVIDEYANRQKLVDK